MIIVAWPQSFCAEKRGVGICRGDSGSGFYVKNDEKVYLRGLVSSAVVRDCSQGNLALYSDVYEYLSFVRNVSNLNFTTTYMLSLKQ